MEGNNEKGRMGEKGSKCRNRCPAGAGSAADTQQQQQQQIAALSNLPLIPELVTNSAVLC